MNELFLYYFISMVLHMDIIYNDEPSSSQSSQTASSQISASQQRKEHDQAEMAKKKDHHKKLFTERIEQIQLEAAKRHENDTRNTSSVVTRERAKEIVNYLTKPLNQIENYNSNKMSNFKTKGLNVQEVDGKQVLFRNDSTENKTTTKAN